MIDAPSKCIVQLKGTLDYAAFPHPNAAAPGVTLHWALFSWGTVSAYSIFLSRRCRVKSKKLLFCSVAKSWGTLHGDGNMLRGLAGSLHTENYTTCAVV